jgi:hypothetical protein
MTENEIKLLGFELNKYSEEEEGYYYSYKIVDGLSLISSDDQEAKILGRWEVDIFNVFPSIRFNKFEEVQSLINLLEKKIWKS